MMLSLNKHINLFITCLLLTASPALAYKVKDISGKKVLIDLENETLSPGDIVISVDKTPDGPQIMGSAKVLQTRPGMAVAFIQDGKFIIGKKIALKAGTEKKLIAGKRKEESEYLEDEEIYETADQRKQRLRSTDEDNLILRRDLLKVALLVSLTQDRFSTKQAYDNPPFVEEETVVMSGGSTGFGLSVDYPHPKWGITLRGVFLTEKVSVSGRAQNNSCDNRTSTNCYANITYLSAGGLIRFDYNIQRTAFWGAAGTVFKQPLARDTTSLRQSDLQMANTMVASLGMDFAFNNRFYMPLCYEYHHSLNTSETVPVIDHHAVMVGFGFKIK